jgi:quinol monooxygenase YgiN
MKDRILVHAEFAIHEGKVADFLNSADEVIKSVEANEPNNLFYEWFISDDKRKCCVVEIFKDSDAVIHHLGTSPGWLSPDVGSLTEGLIYGSASDALNKR